MVMLISSISRMIVKFQLFENLCSWLRIQCSGLVMIENMLQLSVSFRFGVMVVSFLCSFGFMQRCVVLVFCWFGVMVMFGFMLWIRQCGLFWFLIMVVEKVFVLFVGGSQVVMKQCCFIVVQLLVMVRFSGFFLNLLKGSLLNFFFGLYYVMLKKLQCDWLENFFRKLLCIGGGGIMCCSWWQVLLVYGLVLLLLICCERFIMQLL